MAKNTATDTLTPYQHTLSQADVNSLCWAAKVAWNNAGPRTRYQKFTWRKKKFVVSCTIFRLKIHEAETGEAVACVYHDW